MNIEVLVSTMNLKSIEDNIKLIKKMNISSNSLTINQAPGSMCLPVKIDSENKLYSYDEKGLSKSRNKAIYSANSDICVIADDDLVYLDDYENKIIDAYNRFPDADIIAFNVNSLNDDRPTTVQKSGRKKFLGSMKIASFQITFKRKSICDSNIRFDENFGAGSGIFTSGEENIFLTDCIKKGLKIYYDSSTIADVYHNDSTWFNGIYNEKFFETLGACYYRMSKKLYLVLCIQYIVRKKKKYRKDIAPLKAFKIMLNGKKCYKEMEKDI